MFVGLKRVCACPVLLIDWLTTDLKEKSLPQVFCERECGAFSVGGVQGGQRLYQATELGPQKGVWRARVRASKLEPAWYTESRDKGED